MKKKPRPDGIPEQLLQARMHVLEQALIAFVEDMLGRVPTDGEIEKLGFHVSFSDTPLATFECEGWRFQSYYVWDKKAVVAYGFLDPKRPTDLKIIRVDKKEWPVALGIYISQHTGNINNEA